MTDRNNKTAFLPRTRCTPQERKLVESKANEAGLSLSEYQRRSALEAVIVIRGNVADVDAVRQLSAIGNNLNQLSRAGHIRDHINQKYLQSILIEIDEIIQGLIQ